MTTSEKINLFNLIPENWKQREVQLFMYKMFVTNSNQLRKSFNTISGPDFLCVFAEGEMSDAPHVVINGFSGNNIIANVENKRIPFDTYLYIFVLGSINNSEAANKCNYVIGSLIAMFGKNIAYSKIFQSEIKFQECGTPQISVASEAIENPSYFGAATISANTIESTTELFKKISSYDQKTRTRLETAIRWFESATRIGGCDAVLKFWIAIETLIMPDTINIKPIKTGIGKIFKLTETEANIKFKIGRIASLRAEIVHNGFIEPINGNFLRYLQSIFIDLLLFYTEMKFTPISESVLTQYEQDIESVLKSINR